VKDSGERRHSKDRSTAGRVPRSSAAATACALRGDQGDAALRLSRGPPVVLLSIVPRPRDPGKRGLCFEQDGDYERTSPTVR
jgi:hypothetical protein